MLAPITKKMEDHSDEKQFSFSFCCDVCQQPWHSVPMNFSAGKTGSALWEREHEAAYERANQEAMLHFNRCPVCKQWVCDECFHMDESGDACESCLKQHDNQKKERMDEDVLYTVRSSDADDESR